ncbi:MAG: AsnC family transcriptional regulator [Methanobacteriota archaeon]
MPVTDDLQVRIIRELMSPTSFRWDVRESYASIGKKLGVDAETVRKRVKRAQGLGFLQSWRLLPNPDVLGCESTGIHFDVDDESRKPALIEQIKLIDGVVLIIDFHGRALRVVLYYETEQDLSRRIQVMSSLARAQNMVRWTGGIPPSVVVLTKTDWRVVKALRKDPRRRLTEVAGELGISPRTVKRRLARMTAAKSFFVLSMLKGSGYAGAISSFLIFCADEKKKRAVDREMPTKLTRMAFFVTTAKGFSMFTGVCDNLSEAESIYRWVKGLDGVQEVRMDIVRGNLLVDKWLDGEIERRAR